MLHSYLRLILETDIHIHDDRYSYESVASIPTKGLYFTEKFMDVKKVLMDTFFGPPETGVYSPSVQRTLYLMGSAVLKRYHHIILYLFHCLCDYVILTYLKVLINMIRFADVSSIHLKMPNIHFLPVNLSTKENPSMVKVRTLCDCILWRNHETYENDK